MEEIINRLNVMFSHVESEHPLFTTIYLIGDKRGEITYEEVYMKGKNKPLVQTPLIMISSNMRHIVSELNPQTEEDIETIRLGIMEHSKNMVKNYQNDNPTLYVHY